MALPPKKIEILERLLMYEQPTRSKKIAADMKNDFPEIQMHLVGLTKKGYTKSPEKAYYMITEEGKKELGLPEVNRQDAATILEKKPQNQAFHFYLGINNPLNNRAHNLKEFCDEICKVDIHSIEFHINRGDFAAWFGSLGDCELCKKTDLLKRENVIGEELRNRLHEIVEDRYSTLTKLSSQ